MRRSLTCGVFNVLLVYSHKQRFCLVSCSYFISTLWQNRSRHLTIWLWLITKWMKVVKLICASRSIQPPGKDSRWHLQSKIHGKNNKEGSAPQHATAAASTAGVTLPVTAGAKMTEKKQLGGGRGCTLDRLGAWIWDKALEPKEIRKFVGMEQGIAPPPSTNQPTTQTNHPPLCYSSSAADRWK